MGGGNIDSCWCGSAYVVCAHHVGLEAFVVWNQHVAGIGGEMDDHVWWGFRITLLIASGVEVRGEGSEDLAAIGKVCLEGVYARTGIGKLD